jgi:hypothetical protein
MSAGLCPRGLVARYRCKADMMTDTTNCKRKKIQKMAERVGFEPTVRFPARSLSRRVLSTAQPPLHGRFRFNRNRAPYSSAITERAGVRCTGSCAPTITNHPETHLAPHPKTYPGPHPEICHPSAARDLLFPQLSTSLERFLTSQREESLQQLHRFRRK